MKPTLLALLGCAVVVALAKQTRAAETYAEDVSGRTLRVVFDPGRRIHLGAAHAPLLEPLEASADAQRLALDVGLTWQHAIDAEDDTVRWKLEHRFFHASPTVGDASPSIAGELYRIHVLRWSADGSITLPTTPPRRLAFPFGIGFEVGVGRPDLRTESSIQGEIGVAHGALLLDLVPRRTPDGFLTLGIGPRYDLRLDTTTPTAEVDHLIVPFSQPELAFYRHSQNGHHAFEARARAGYVWSNDHGAGTQAAAHLAYEAIVLAVNDSSVSLVGQLRWRYDDPPRPGSSPHELIAAYGLRLGLPLD